MTKSDKRCYDYSEMWYMVYQIWNSKFDIPAKRGIPEKTPRAPAPAFPGPHLRGLGIPAGVPGGERRKNPGKRSFGLALCFSLAEQILSLALMVVAGLFLAKAGLVDGPGCRSLSTICVYIFTPCMILGGFLIDWNRDKITGMLIALVGSAVIHLCFLFFARLLQSRMRFSDVDHASLVYTNAGNILIPLVAGTLGQEYIFYTCSYMVVQNLLIWSYTANVIGGCRGFQFRRVLKNPVILAILVGFVYMLFPFSLPGALETAIRSVGGCMAPASMILVGVLLAGLRLRGDERTRGAWRVVFLRLAVCPFITLALLYGMIRLVDHPDIWPICFVLALAGSGPSASLVTQVAQLYDNQSDRASYINAVTTVLCSLTLPVVTLLAQRVLL